MSSISSNESQTTADQIHSLAIHLLRRLRREDDASGLNAPRLSALSVIVFGGPITLGDLAAAEQVRPPTMTRIVNALEEQGLVLRTKSSTDARSIHLTATPAGRQLLAEGRERRVRLLAARIEALPPAKRALLKQSTALLQEIVRSI